MIKILPLENNISNNIELNMKVFFSRIDGKCIKQSVHLEQMHSKSASKHLSCEFIDVHFGSVTLGKRINLKYEYLKSTKNFQYSSLSQCIIVLYLAFIKKYIIRKAFLK